MSFFYMRTQGMLLLSGSRMVSVSLSMLWEMLLRWIDSNLLLLCSIQKETPKKKPKLETKPSNGDR